MKPLIHYSRKRVNKEIMTVSFSIVNILVCIYTGCFIFFNIFGYYITSFYKKRFKQDFFQLGFILAAIGGLSYIPLIFVTPPDFPQYDIIKNTVIYMSSGGATLNALLLYKKMTKPTR